MANPIAEAFISIRPDLAAFESETRRGVERTLRSIQVSAAAQQNVGQQVFGGTGFRQAVTTGTTQALAQTTVSQAAQRSLAQKIFASGFRDETGRAIQGALVGLGGGELAARFAFFGAGGAAIAALGAGFLIAARSAGTFEQSLNNLQAVTRISDEELKQFSDVAKQLGADITLPAVTAQTAADAMTELARAGLSAADTLAAARGVLQLSTAANIDAASAARITASALNAFSLAGTEAVHVADLLAAASVASQGDIQDTALAFQQSAAVAKLSNLSIEQLAGAITILAQKGLIGSDAGTSLRTALLRLIPTTKEAAQLMDVLGISIDRTRTLGAQLPQLLDQYQTALGRLNPTLRQSTLAQIAGQDAVRSLSILIEGGSDAFERSIDTVNRQGAAAELSTAKTQGLLGALEGLNSTVATLSINIGQVFSPVLEEAARDLTAIIGPANAAVEALGGLGDIDIPGTDLGLAEFARSVILQINPLTQIPERARLAGEGLKKLGVEFGVEGAVIERVGKRIQELNKELTALDQADPRVLEIRVEIQGLEEIAAQLGGAGAEATVLRGQIQDLKRTLFDPGTSRGQALAIQGRLAELEKQLAGLPAKAGKVRAELDDIFTGPFKDVFTPPLDKLAQDLKAAIPPDVLGQQLRRAITQLEREDLPAEVREISRATALSLISELSKLGPEGERVLRSIGGRLMRGLGSGISAEEQVAIDAARHALEQIRAEGDRQIQEAIRSARGNLESLGETIGDALADIIDVGPIGQAINEIERQLDALQERVTRRQLRFDLTQAKRDLREAQESLATVGVLTPEQRRAQEEFLDPFREKVLDANAAAKEFDLTEQRDELEKTRDAAVRAADEGIQRLISRFEAGQVSAGEFERVLRGRLGPAFDVLESKAGQDLGLVFTRDFQRDVTALIGQVEELSAFFPLGGGTTPGAQVVRPSATQADVNRRIAESAASLARIEADAKTLSKDEQELAETTNSLLSKILKALGGGPGGGTRRPGERADVGSGRR